MPTLPHAPAHLVAVLALATLGSGAVIAPGPVAAAPAVRAGPASGDTGNARSFESTVSAGGRFVAFVSNATNLDGADTDSIKDVFVRDTATNTTTLVSRATGASGAKGNGNSESPSISADGRYVAFQSTASNLDPADRNGGPDVFVRDRTTSTTALISRDTAENVASVQPAISADGQYVAYAAAEVTFTTVPPRFGFTRTVSSVFVRNRQTGAVSLVSGATGPDGTTGTGVSTSPRISGDGRYVAFASGASNAPAPVPVTDLFLRDRQANMADLIAHGTVPDSISADGRYVVFTSTGEDGLPVGRVFARDRQTGVTTLLSRQVPGGHLAFGGMISADGRSVVYTTSPSDPSPFDPSRASYVYVNDLATGVTTVITHTPFAPIGSLDLGSPEPDISPGGRFVTFASRATNLDPAANDFVQEVFLRDRMSDTTSLVSRATGPLPAPVFPAKLSVARARVQRSPRMLDVLAPITARASGRVRVEFRAAGRTTRFSVPIDAGNRRVRFTRRIPAVQSALGTGILTLTYQGDADTQPQTVRLRAAAGRADLKAGRPRIVDGRLIASGTVTPKARGVVRVQLVYQLINPATTRTVQFTAPISGGRYRLDTKLGDTVATEISVRAGSVHSYVLFTGYLKRRIRGELRSYQVLGPR